MISENRLSYWLHLIVDGLLEKSLLECMDKDKVIRAARRAGASFMQEHKRIEEKARQKIVSLKRDVPESSTEWGVLYSNYYDEELSRSHISRTKGSGN